MPKFETDRKKIIKRLERDGWSNTGGSRHDIFRHPTKAGVVNVPRHKTISPGVARQIAKATGWTT